MLFLLVPTTWAAPHWSAAPAMSASADVLLAAAAADTSTLEREDGQEAPVQVLLDESIVTVSADGSHRMEHRLVFRLLNDSAVRGWGTWGVGWDTWRESRPVLSARVIQADGDIYFLDPDLVAESAAPGDPMLLSDNISFQAPLPHLEVGAIIEEVMVYEHVKPLLDGYFFHMEELERRLPSERRVVRVIAPKGMLLQAEIHGTESEFKLKKKGDIQTLELVLEDAWPIPGVPESAPLDVPRYASLSISSAPDWGVVADGYRALVADQFATDGLSEIIDELKDMPREAQIAAALEMILARTRYTGVLFDETRIVPNPPAVMLERGFGDCKDLSTTLVTILRALDFEAHLALLRVGHDEGRALSTPGLGRFNHAIVYVDGEDLWIDPTNPFVDPQAIPISIQGLPALVIAPETEALTTIPRPPSSESVWSDEIHYTVPYRGSASQRHTTEASGFIAAWLRELYAESPDVESDQLRETIQTHLEPEEIMSAEVTPSSDLHSPWRTYSEVSGVGNAGGERGGGTVFPEEFTGFYALPSELTPPMGWLSGQPADIEYPIEFAPYSYRLDLTIDHSAELIPDMPESDESWQAGDATLSRTVSHQPGSVNLQIVVDTGSGRLSPEDAMALREIIKQFEPWPEDGILLEHAGWIAFEEGDVARAIPILRTALADNPDDTIRRLELVNALMKAGLMEAAWRELEPIRGEDDAEVWFAEANLHARDAVGRLLKGDFSRKLSLKAVRRAIALDEASMEARALLTELLKHNEHGRMYGEGADVCGAAEQLHYLVVELEVNALKDDLLHTASICGERAVLGDWMEEVGGPLVFATELSFLVREEGAEAALLKMEAESSSQQIIAAVAPAVLLLLEVEAYGPARELIEATQSRPAFELLFEGLKNYEEVLDAMDRSQTRSAESGSPEAVLIELLRASESGDPEALEGYFSRYFDHPLDRIKFTNALNRSWDKRLPFGLGIDNLIGTLELEVEGEEDIGYRVNWTGKRLGKDHSGQLYLVREGRRLKVIGDQYRTRSIAAHAQALAASGETDAALLWLEWKAEGQGQTSARAPLEDAPWLHLLRMADPGMPESVEVAAIALSSWEGEADPVLAARMEALRETLSEAGQAQVDRTMAGMWSRIGDLEQVLSAVERLLVAYPDEFSLLRRRATAMARLDPDAAQAQLEALREIDDDDSLLPTEAWIAYGRGDLDAALVAFRVAGEAGNLISENNLYWYSLFGEALEETLVDEAATYYKDLEFHNVSRFNTTAAVEASAGRQIQALERLHQALDIPLLAPESLEEWWLVLGLIAEAAGEIEMARTAYETAPRHPLPKQDLGLFLLERLEASQ